MGESTIVGSSTFYEQLSKIKEADKKKGNKRKFIPPVIRKKPKPEDNIMKDFYDSDDMPESERTPKKKKAESPFRLNVGSNHQTLQVTMNANSLSYPRDSVVGNSMDIKHTDYPTPIKPTSISKDSTTRDVKSPEWPVFTPYNNLESIDSLHQQVWPHDDNNTSIQDQSQMPSNIQFSNRQKRPNLQPSIPNRNHTLA